MFRFTQSIATVGSSSHIIKIHGSESQGQEGAACIQVFWPTQPTQWVIYMDGNSKVLKCCKSATTVVLLA